MASLYQKFISFLSNRSSRPAKGYVGIEHFEAKIILACPHMSYAYAKKPCAQQPAAQASTIIGHPVTDIIRRSVTTGELLEANLVNSAELVKEATEVSSYEPPAFSKAQHSAAVRPMRRSFARKLPVPTIPSSADAFKKAS